MIVSVMGGEGTVSGVGAISPPDTEMEGAEGSSRGVSGATGTVGTSVGVTGAESVAN